MSTRSWDATQIIESRPLLLERFEVVRILGEGAAGAVYLVNDRKNGTNNIALKILLNAQAFDEHTYERFKSEWEISQALRHPNIVEAYELIELNDVIAFTMEYVPGQDLRKILDAKNLSYEIIDKIMIQLLSALDYLHTHNVFHRDIKLENILITPSSFIKLSDLGLIKQNNEEKLTKTGILLGTAQYMAPEYIMKSHYTNQSDIFACGVVLYELLEGKRWLGDKSGHEVITYLIQNDFALPQPTREKLPEKYKFILKNALDPKASKRFKNAKLMSSYFQTPANSKIWQNINDSMEDSNATTKINKLDQVKASKTPSNLIFISILTGITLILFTSLFIYMLPSGISEFPAGSFEGELQVASEDQSFPSTIQAGSSGAILTTISPFCQNGFISFEKATLTCGKKEFKVKLSKNSAGQIELDFANWLRTQATFVQSIK